MSVFKWFEATGLIAQRKYWLIRQIASMGLIMVSGCLKSYLSLMGRGGIMALTNNEATSLSHQMILGFKGGCKPVEGVQE